MRIVSKFTKQASVLTLALLLVSLSAEGVAAQQFRTLTGRVTSAETGETLAGAQISIARSDARGVVAGGDGTFSFQVPAGDVTLEVRFIGHKTTQVAVPEDQSNVEISLEIDPLGLDELVVSGRATEMSRRNLTAATSTVLGDRLVELPWESVEQTLYAKVPGANVTANSGAPGGGLQIDIRGVTTVIGEFKPLWVVDGVIVNNDTQSSGVFTLTGSSSNPERGGLQDNAPNRIADLNPDDIESIHVLKGAAATAQYGSKASNGVILVTTKKGRTGPPAYNFRFRGGFPDRSQSFGLREFNSVEDAVAAFGEPAREFFEPGKFIDHEEIIAGRNPFSYDIIGNASGATGDTRYFASGLVRDAPAVVIGTFAKNQSVRLNLDSNIGNSVDFSLNLNGIHSVSDRGIFNNDNQNVSIWLTLPFTPSFFDLRPGPDGKFPANPFTRSNPLETVNKVENEEVVWRFIGSTLLTAHVVETPNQTFRLRALAGIDFLFQQNNLLSPADLQFEGDDGLFGTSVKGDLESQNLNVEGSAIYNRLFSDGAISSTTSAGIQFEVRDRDFSRVTTRNLIAGQTNVDRGTAVDVLAFKEREEDLGFFVQEELLFGDRLALVLGFRADQSSNNTVDDKLFVFPRAAASYVFDNLGFIDELKIRAAYGESGNRPLFGQKFTELVGATVEGLGTLGIAGSTAADLEPERQREIEAGIDVTMFDERLTLEATFFNKTVTNVLLQRELAPSTGFAAAVFNGGKLRVKGFEAGVSGIVVSTRDLNWTFNGVFTLVRAEMVDLPVEPFQVEGFGFLFGTFQLAEGESPTAMWGNVTLADGTVTTGIVGNSNPDFRVGWSTDIEFRNLRFHTLWDWQQGSNIFDLTRLLFDLGQNTTDCNDAAVGILQGSENDPASAPLPGESVCQQRLRLWPSNLGVYTQSATFLKARELGLSWKLPESIAKAVGARIVRVSFMGRNLFTFTPFTGLDPEVSNFGGTAIGRNLDVSPFPPSRSFWFGFDIGF